jgi:hypothetical protein
MANGLQWLEDLVRRLQPGGQGTSFDVMNGQRGANNPTNLGRAAGMPMEANNPLNLMARQFNGNTLNGVSSC